MVERIDKLIVEPDELVKISNCSDPQTETLVVLQELEQQLLGSEALAQETTDIKGETLTFRKSTTVRQAENPRRGHSTRPGETAGRIQANQRRGAVSRYAGCFAYTNSVRGR